MRECPVPIPDPRANKGGHVGYTAYRIEGPTWSSGFTGKTFYDDQCKNVGSLKVSLDKCKSQCEAKTGCNGINFNAKSSRCIMRECPVPIPDPRANKGGHVGFTAYRIEADKPSSTSSTESGFKKFGDNCNCGTRVQQWATGKSTVDLCSKACESNAKCKSFGLWTKKSKSSGYCALFDKVCTTTCPKPTNVA